MKRKTHRTETHIETHEIKIIRFGTQRVDVESDDDEKPPPLITEHAAGHNPIEGDGDGDGDETDDKNFSVGWCDLVVPVL